MKKLALAIALLLTCVQAQAQTLVISPPILGFTPAQVFNVTDYGAKCDGSTNDNTAINAALTAAATSTAYTNNNAVEVTGPQNGSAAGCVMNSLNLTQFNKGTSANTRARLFLKGLVLLCTGVGNICLDGLNSDFVTSEDVSIRGDTAPNSPEIGIQIGISSQNAVSAFHVFNRVNVNGEFALAAIYNVASETFNCFACYFTNVHTTTGPIGVLGSITGGSAYTNGTYTGVALTGGSGTGALATVVVSGGAISSVTITYEGRDYASSNTLSAAAASIGGTGSGFSVPISTVTPYVGIWDGQNHWRVASAFTAVTTPTETWESFTGNKFFGGSFKQNGAGKAAFWAARTMGLHFYQTYVYGGTSTPSYCLALYDNGITKSGVPTGNSSFSFDTANCEGAVSGTVLFTGGNAAPTLNGFNFYEANDAGTSSRPVFVADTGITSVTLPNANIRVDWFLNGTTAPMFGAPSLYTITGNAYAQTATNWGTPASFSGTLCTPVSCVPFNSFGIIAKSGAPSPGTVTGTTSETVLATITIPASTLGANGQIKINAYWSATVSANTKTFRIRLGGLSGSVILSEGYSNLSAATVWSSSILFNQNATNAQTTATELSRGDGLVTTAFLTTAVDMTQSQSMVLTGQLVTTSENVTLLGYTVEVVN